MVSMPDTNVRTVRPGDLLHFRPELGLMLVLRVRAQVAPSFVIIVQGQIALGASDVFSSVETIRSFPAYRVMAFVGLRPKRFL
jgi:hypothetical protein